jgi:hypothetical protein
MAIGNFRQEAFSDHLYQLLCRKNLQHTHKTVVLTLQEEMAMLAKTDQHFKDEIKGRLCVSLADDILPSITFTQVRKLETLTTNVIGRVYVFSEKELFILLNGV